MREIPAPGGDPKAPLQALIFDSLYDAYEGVIVFCRLMERYDKEGYADPHDGDRSRGRGC